MKANGRILYLWIFCLVFCCFLEYAQSCGSSSLSDDDSYEEQKPKKRKGKGKKKNIDITDDELSGSGESSGDIDKFDKDENTKTKKKKLKKRKKKKTTISTSTATTTAYVPRTVNHNVRPLTGRFGEDLSVEDIMRSYGVDPDMFTSYGFSPSTKQNILYVVTSGIFVIMYLKYIKS